MRKFYIESGNGNRYDLQSSKCFLNQPSGLGFAKDIEYATVGNYFIIDFAKNNQKNITGSLIFMGDYYANYQEFITFIKSNTNYKLVYVVNDQEYLIDVDINEVTKSDTDKKNFLSCEIVMNSKSLFYTKTINQYHLIQTDGGSRWDTVFDFMFTDEIPGEVLVNNEGHVPASFEFEIIGPVDNPVLEVYEDGILINTLTFTISLAAGEKLLFGNKDNDLYVLLDDGVDITNEFNALDIANANFFKLRVGTSLLSFNGDSPIPELTITTYEEYEAV